MAEEQTQKPKTSTKSIFIGCGVLVAGVILIAVAMGTCLGGGSSTKTKDLSPSVSFDGTQFTITNNDSFGWSNIKFTLNSNYELSYSFLFPKSTYTVGAMQFTKSDGTRFNPFTMKPLNMSISCELAGGEKGWWYGSWK
jgi:hypothetical protein